MHNRNYEFHETCHSVTFIVVINSHQRWKQTRNRVGFHRWCELTLALRCHSIVWGLFGDKHQNLRRPRPLFNDFKTCSNHPWMCFVCWSNYYIYWYIYYPNVHVHIVLVTLRTEWICIPLLNIFVVNQFTSMHCFCCPHGKLGYFSIITALSTPRVDVMSWNLWNLLFRHVLFHEKFIFWY